MRLLQCATFAALAPLAAWAQSSSMSALAGQLGNSQALQGQQQSLSPFALTVLTNETHALVSVNISQSQSAVGYGAVGFGSSMANADMIIFWPNSDASWTVSHRTAGGHVMPAPVTSQPSASDLSIVSSLTTNSSASPFAAFAFLRPLSPSSSYGGKAATLSRASGQQFIYAYSKTNPGSSNQAASIVQHDQGSFGSTTLDLSQAVSGNAPIVSAPQATVSAPWTRRDSIIVLHALCGAMAWLIVAPVAVLIGRWGRNVQGWFRAHQLLQSVLTGILTVAAVALGAISVNEAGSGHLNTPHKVMGYVLLLLLILQLSLGFYIHKLFAANRTKRPLRNVVHILLGVALICIGYAQVYEGFKQYARPTPGYIVAIATLSLAGFLIAYLFSALRLAQVRREKGMNLSHSLFGLGRNSPIALGEKHLLDPFAQPPRSPRMADMTTHDRAAPPYVPATTLPISDQHANRTRPEWIQFDHENESQSELPWSQQVQADSRVSRPHYGAMRHYGS